MERRRSWSRRRRIGEQLRAILVGAAIVAMLVTSVAFVAGAGGRPRYVGPERDPLRERLEAQLEGAERSLRVLASQLEQLRGQGGSRLACAEEQRREAERLVDSMRIDVAAFRASTATGNEAINRLRAIDRARAAEARISSVMAAAAECH